MTKLISDYAKVEISNKVKDILRMYHSSSWNSEPYHESQNPAEGRYCTLKSWTNTIMNGTGAPANCWLLCMIHASYILSHVSCEALDGNVPLSMLYGVSPDISILLLYTFYQPVFYATHNQSYPSVSEERILLQAQSLRNLREIYWLYKKSTIWTEEVWPKMVSEDP